MCLLIKQSVSGWDQQTPVFDGLFAMAVIKLCQYGPVITPADADDDGSEAGRLERRG